MGNTQPLTGQPTCNCLYLPTGASVARHAIAQGFQCIRAMNYTGLMQTQ